MKVHSILADKGDDVLTIRPDDDLIRAAQLMRLHEIAALVVTEDDRAIKVETDEPDYSSSRPAARPASQSIQTGAQSVANASRC